MTQLRDFSRNQNQRTLKRLRLVMRQYNLKKTEVATMLDVSRSLVTRWFKDEKKCPDNAPELLRAICAIEGKTEALMKRKRKE